MRIAVRAKVAVRARIAGLVALAAGGLLLAAIACGDGENAANSASSPDESQQSASPAATGSHAAADSEPLMQGDHAVIRQGAVGPLRVGEWRRPVMSFVYAISARAGRDSEDIITVHRLGVDTVTLSFRKDTLRKIFITRAGPHTADSIGVGTPFATVTARPGAKVRTLGSAKIATIDGLCGVEFATDSFALGADSMLPSPVRQTATIQGIAVGYCKR
jgi:hypothetical protein